MILFYDGFDDTDNTTLIQVWSAHNSIPGGSGIVSGAGRFAGTNGLRSWTTFTGSTSISNVIKNLPVVIQQTDELFIQIGARCNTFAALQVVRIFTLYDANTGIIFGCYLRSDGSFAFERYNGNPDFPGYADMYTTDPDLMQASAYRTLEFRLRMSATAGIVEMRIDEDPVTLYLQSGFVATATAAGTSARYQVSRVGISGNPASAPTMVVDFDDPIFFNNVANPDPTYAASDPVTWLGDVRCQTLFPDGAGATTMLTPVPVVANWQNVDDTVADSDTTYVWGTTVGDLDLYTFTNLVGSVSSIVSVAACKTVKKEDGTVREVSALIRSGGTTAVLEAKNVPTSYYQDFTNTTVNPVTTVAYTPAEVNAIEAGAQIIT